MKWSSITFSDSRILLNMIYLGQKLFTRVHVWTEETDTIILNHFHFATVMGMKKFFYQSGPKLMCSTAVLSSQS